jgi:hypothetical protein
MKRILSVTAPRLLLCCVLIGRADSAKPDRDIAHDAGAEPQSQKSNEKNADREKKKKKWKDSNEISASQTFSEEVAATIIERLAKGLEDHNERAMFSAFDSNRMDGYVNFQNQVHAMFESYDAFRVHYRIAEVTTDDQKGVVAVDFELEESAGAGSIDPLRKQDQLRFEMERGENGWKIVDVTPRTFFS